MKKKPTKKSSKKPSKKPSKKVWIQKIRRSRYKIIGNPEAGTNELFIGVSQIFHHKNRLTL